MDEKYVTSRTARYLYPELVRLIEENERMKTSLGLIVNHPVGCSKQWEVACLEMQKVARKALEEKDD